ncbi:glycosyltransferase family 8 protein [Microseira wollei]|uniref:Glycosyl transferase family 8 n=1 Tax=Microseira wollei NIES-4236 TaxID=2530354 RepID=A0AAV3XCE3_9CYAN|nr:glycosyltransferase family 8 protein [Microseira wollei]GET37062.1 glycosyl transferase family 8 [Microseira wollei NIES-4236]
MTIINSDKEPIVLVLAADNNYAMALAATARSVIANLNHNKNIEIVIIDGGIKEYNKKKIIKSIKENNVEIKWVKAAPEIFKNMKVYKHFSKATYYRLLLPKILPLEITKAIYLDTDIIVKENLENLWNIDIGNNYVLAVEDMSVRYVSAPNGLKNYEELGIKSDAKYFNAGVLVINIEKWRTDKSGEKVIEYLEKYQEQWLWLDQDGLNAAFAGQWGELDPKWNQQPRIYKYASWKESPYQEDVYQDLRDNPYIIHYSTSGKPWSLGCKHPKKDLFFEYLDKTAWSGWRLHFWRRVWLKVKIETYPYWKHFYQA